MHIMFLMKPLSILLALAIPAIADASPPAAGSISKNVQYSLSKGSSFQRSSLGKNQNKIVVLMMMTPWCPICQSHSRAVGTDILSHFNDPARGNRQGRNARGVPIESILLSTEEAPQWDNVNSQFAAQNGFRQWGLDAKPDRTSPRQLLGFYRGGFIDSTNLYDWGDDRRRLVIINMVKKSRRHEFREILVNVNEFSAADAKAVIRRIDRVQRVRKRR